jgi:hypothetical protein
MAENSLRKRQRAKEKKTYQIERLIFDLIFVLSPPPPPETRFVFSLDSFPGKFNNNKDEIVRMKTL